MASHDYHDALPGYDERQILHDGCGECEYRAENVERAIANLDQHRFEKAWRRAYNEFAFEGAPDGGPRSRAEMPVLTALWAVMLQLERRGIPLDGTPPGSVVFVGGGA